MSTERAAHFTPGPRFFRDGDDVMFEFVIDGSNVIGPRKATDADKEKHSRAWAELNGEILPEEEPAVPPVVAFGKARARKR